MKEFILYDLEFTTWDGAMQRNWSKPNEHREVIQWGALKINENLEIVDVFSEFVKPEINPELDIYCKNLTGIEQSSIDEAGSFKEVLSDFIKFRGDNKIISLSWGNDFGVLDENISLTNIESVIKKEEFMDLKYYFDLEKIDTQGKSSGELSAFFNLQELGSVHDANYDTMSLYLTIKHFKDKLLKYLLV